MKWLVTFLFLFTLVNAEEITTGNLLPNAGDGVDWGSNSTDQINPGASGYVNNGDVVNGFTITCPESQSNCGYQHSTGGDFEVTGTSTVSVDNINLTNNTISQEMLNNGITLNSYIDVANCDSQPGNCEGRSGNADSHTVTIELKDSLGNTLSTTTQTRTEIVGFQGNCNGYPSSKSGSQTADCGQYNDQVIYNNHGSNKVDWSWTGVDNNNSNNSLGGPNLLGAALTMTYDDTVIDNSIIEEIEDIFDSIDEDIINDIVDNIQEPDFEIDMSPPEFESITIAEEFVEDFYMEMDQEFFIEDQGPPVEQDPIVEMANEEMIEEIIDPEFNPLFEGVTLDLLKQQGWAKGAVDSPRRKGINSGIWPTPSGKIEIYSQQLSGLGLDPMPVHVPEVEGLSGVDESSPYPLQVFSAATHYFIGSTFQHVEDLQNMLSRPTVELSPQDANKRSIVEGDYCRLFNDRGEVFGHAHIVEGMRPGVLGAPKQLQGSKMKNGFNLNALTSQKEAELGRGPVYYSTLAEIQKVDVSPA